MFTSKLNESVCLDQNTISDLIQMYYGTPDLKIARDSFLSMTLSLPFTFEFTALGLVSNSDMEYHIVRFWLPWQRKVFDYLMILGVCPYYLKRVGEHNVPIVPDVLVHGSISVLTSAKHEISYKWMWNNENDFSPMYWVVEDHAPLSDGTIRSPLSSLLPLYKTILVLQRSLENVATQNAHPSHILEYHPSATSTKNDDLTHLVAKFGEATAGVSKLRQDEARARNIRVRTDELREQIQSTYQYNMSVALNQKRRLAWTDLAATELERMDSGLANNTIPLSPDFKYVHAARSTITEKLSSYIDIFTTRAAAVIGFTSELYNPTSSSRLQGQEGSKRFLNERVKACIKMFERHTKSALVIAYRRQFDQGAQQHVARLRKEGNQDVVVANIVPELDVKVIMHTTPFISYEDLKRAHIDGIISHDTFARHAGRLMSVPEEDIDYGAKCDCKEEKQPKSEKKKRKKEDLELIN